MSSATWTPAALWSERRRLAGRCWRVVEAQHRVSTMKLVDTLDEQALLETVLERSKPPIPPECRHLHYLLATPFRYGATYPHGSRFRRPGVTPGVYYGSATPVTAIAEMAFHRLLFFVESPATPWPANAGEFTMFAVEFATRAGIDLTRAPFDDQRDRWTHRTDYRACQDLADGCRAAGITALGYESARDPGGGINLALLSCAPFVSLQPVERQTWRVALGLSGVGALCAHPEGRLEFGRDAFAGDSRMAALRWER